MSKKSTIKPVAAALGTAFALTLAAAPAANASSNPFGMTDLNAGYSIAMGDKPSEGKCSADKKAESKCGAEKKKAEAKCSAAKKAEGTCSAEKKAEGKCAGSK